MQGIDMDLVSGLLQAVLMAILPILAASAARWLLVMIDTQRKKLDADTLRVIEQIAKVAVLAAEQVHAAGFIADKKMYAMKMAQAWLDSRNLNINVGIIEGAVEAAVLKEFNSQWLSGSVPPVAQE